MDTWLFDVDGTLLDSREPILHSLNAAFLENGIRPLTADKLAPYVGPPLQAMLEMLLDERGQSTRSIPTLIDHYRSVYRTVAVEMAVAYPGVSELLVALGGRVRLGVATSKPLAFTVPILEALGFAPMFDVIEGPGLEEPESKRDTMARAINRLEHRSALTALTMVGDRHHDIEGGIHHGATTIGVTWGFGTRAELVDAGADYIVDYPDELLGFVG